MWLVSSRGSGCNVEQQAPGMACWRFDPEARWVRASVAELFAADDGHLVTTIFVHGNRMAHSDAFARGSEAYRAMLRCADERPVRFIIWSWPSAQIRGPIKDARVKAQRTNLAGCYLAWFLNRLSPETTVSLWGHSFGARVVTGALHILGGGTLGSYRIAVREEPRVPANVVLITAALDNHWLAPGHFHGRALSQVGSLLLVNNGCDRLLKRYHWLYHRRACAQALGYTGMPRCWMGQCGCHLEQVNACCIVGPEHTLDGYLYSRSLMARMQRVLMFEPIDELTPDEPATSSTKMGGEEFSVGEELPPANDESSDGPVLPAIP